MKSKMKLVGLLCLVGLCANIVAASATVGVAVGDSYVWNMKSTASGGGESYTLKAKFTAEITAISAPYDYMGSNSSDITYDFTVSDISESGDSGQVLESGTEEDIEVMISEDADYTESMILIGAYFIDADAVDKTYSDTESEMGITINIDITYNSNGVLEEYIMDMEMDLMGTIIESESSVKLSGGGGGIPGFPAVMVGIVSLFTIPLLIRKIRK